MVEAGMIRTMLEIIYFGLELSFIIPILILFIYAYKLRKNPDIYRKSQSEDFNKQQKNYNSSEKIENEETKPEKYYTESYSKEILEDNNMVNSIAKNVEIIMPDNVKKESTNRSTQNEDCKKYNAEIKFGKVKEVVVKSNKSYSNSKYTNDTNDDDPIKTNESIKNSILKVFKPKIDRL